MSCLKIIYDCFEMFVSKLSDSSEYLHTEIQSLTKYKDKYIYNEDSNMDLEPTKINIQNSEVQTFRFEFV